MTVKFQHEKLRQQREEKNLTQEILAERCDCSARYLRDLEAGRKHNPSGALLVQLGMALGMPAETLYITE